MHLTYKDPAEVKKGQLIKLLKVKEITAFGYAKDGSGLLEGKPVIIEIYDELGELIELYNWLEENHEIKKSVAIDKLNNTKTYCYDNLEFQTFDSNNRLIERKEYRDNKQVKVWHQFEYENLPDGIEMCKEYDHRKRYIGKTVSKTDGLGNILFEVSYDESDSPTGKNTYQYDANHRLVKATKWFVITRRSRANASKNYVSVYYSDLRYDYHTNGRLTAVFRFNIDETIDWSQSETYKYDELNHIVEEHYFDEGGKINLITSYEYDDFGNLISEIVTDSEGRIFTSRTSKFDKSGLEEELVIDQNEGGRYVKYTYFYEYYQ